MNQYCQRTWRKPIRHMIRHLQTQVSAVLPLVQYYVVEGERTVVFTRDSLFQSVLTEQGENTSTNTGLRRNHRQNDDPFDSSLDGRMYENTENPALCPVRAFELYLSKFNSSLDLLWQRPKAFDNFQRS